jgi:hypothetical protein
VRDYQLFMISAKHCKPEGITAIITMARAGPGTGEIEFFGLIFSPYCVNKYIFFLEFVSA